METGLYTVRVGHGSGPSTGPVGSGLVGSGHKKFHHGWVRMDRVQSFMLISGWVVLGHFSYGSSWVGSRKLDPRPTLLTLKVGYIDRYIVTVARVIGWH